MIMLRECGAAACIGRPTLVILDHEADIGMSRLGRFPTFRGRP